MRTDRLLFLACITAFAATAIWLMGCQSYETGSYTEPQNTGFLFLSRTGQTVLTCYKDQPCQCEMLKDKDMKQACEQWRNER